ncbi:MAG: cupin domain-containing protein [Proteobacteria bacterium]|jgi:quercetin dioxygenase-like cupin family protein|nr:cupin domain-containing protein [Pseudomonadota bacterium]
MPSGQAVELKGLVEYQSGAIVSREIAKTKGGTATLFAFDAGQGLSEHTAPFDAIITVLEGEAEVAVGGAPTRPVAGQAVLMPANIPHAVHALGRFKMLIIMLRD